MKKAQKETKQTKNLFIEQSKLKDYTIICNQIIKDNRINHTQKSIYVCLKSLVNFKITTKATSKFLNLNEKTLIKHLNDLIKYGYITRKRINNKQFIYYLNDNGTPEKFILKDIENYSLETLYKFLNDKTTPKKYLNLIKKYLNIKIELRNEINQFIEKEQKEQNEQENNILPFE